MNPEALREIKPFLILLSIVAFALILGDREQKCGNVPAIQQTLLPDPLTSTRFPTPLPVSRSTLTLHTTRIAPRRRASVGVVRTTLDGLLTVPSAIVENDKTPQHELVSPIRRLCEHSFFVHWNRPLRAVFLRDMSNHWREVPISLVLIDRWAKENDTERLVGQEAYVTPRAISDATNWGAQVTWNDGTGPPEIEYSK